MIPASTEGVAAKRARAAARIDVSKHNAGGAAPTFDQVVSQVVSAAQFSHPEFERLRGMMFPEAGAHSQNPQRLAESPHRKLWEFCYILRAADQHGRLEPGRQALGFGVGREPIPAALASLGLTVLATDLEASADGSAGWATGRQHMFGLEALSKPAVVSDEALERQVRTRFLDMKAIPDDLGRFDLIWSSSALEHLGSPEAGLEFVVATLNHLEPGGVSVHTTELELVPRNHTADYGHMAVYRPVDLDHLRVRVRALGFEMHANWYVSMDAAADRWVSLPPYPPDDPAHLKLTIGGSSVSTSVGLLIRRPESKA